MPPKRTLLTARKVIERNDHKTIRVDSKLDISKWFNDDTFSDCMVLSADDAEFHLHKVVLSHISEPFRAMLTTDMRERRDNTITLSEDSHTLHNLFALIYEGKFEGNYKEFMDLSACTKKYLIMDLHEECVKKLQTFLNYSNAVQLLILAHENELEELEKKTLKCIGRNFELIRTSDDWELLLDNHEALNLAVDAFINRVHREKEIQMNRSTNENISMVLNSSVSTSDDSESE